MDEDSCCCVCLFVADCCIHAATSCHSHLVSSVYASSVEGVVLQHNWQLDKGLLLDMGNNNVMKLFIMCDKPH